MLLIDDVMLSIAQSFLNFSLFEKMEADIKVENSDNKLRTESVQTKSRELAPGQRPNSPTLKLRTPRATARYGYT